MGALPQLNVLQAEWGGVAWGCADIVFAWSQEEIEGKDEHVHATEGECCGKGEARIDAVQEEGNRCWFYSRGWGILAAVFAELSVDAEVNLAECVAAGVGGPQ